MIQTKTIRKLLASLPNVGRGISAMFFNAAAFFVLKNSGNKQLILEFSWCLILTNIFVTVTGWGLRDYSVKEYVKDLSAASSRFALLLSGKVPLFILSLCVIYFIPLNSYLRLCLMVLVFLRTIMSLVDPLILTYNRTLRVFLWECFAYIPAIGAICIIDGMGEYIITILILMEILRVMIALLHLRGKGVLIFKWINPLSYLYETRYYFFIALFSFCMSRVDVYILGLFSKDGFFGDYNIILNLLAFSQIVIASVYNNTMKSIFRINLNAAGRILRKLTLQFLVLSIVFTLGIALIATFIYAILPGTWFYLLLFTNVFFYCLTLKYIYILNHAGKPVYFLIASGISSLVNFVGAFILIPILGMNGAMMSNTFGVIILVTVLYYLVAKNNVLLAPAEARWPSVVSNYNLNR